MVATPARPPTGAGGVRWETTPDPLFYVVMSKSAKKYLSGVVALLLLSALAGVYLQGALRIFICAAIVLGMLYLVVKIVRGERAQ